MNSKTLALIAGIFLSLPAVSETVYKCTKADNSVILTDRECPANTKSQVLHKDTEQQIKNRQAEEKIWTLKQLIAGNQAEAAKQYAIEHDLTDVYYQELSAYASKQAYEKKQDAELEKEQQAEIQQQQLVIQRQQVANPKTQTSQQPSDAQTYYRGRSYGRGHHSTPYVGTTPPFTAASPQISNGGMNPPMTSPTQTNSTPTRINSLPFGSEKRR